MCTLESGHRCEQISLTLHYVVIFHRVRYQTIGFRICRKENPTTSPVYRGDEICLTSTTVSWSQHDGRRREGKRKTIAGLTEYVDLSYRLLNVQCSRRLLIVPYFIL